VLIERTTVDNWSMELTRGPALWIY